MKKKVFRLVFMLSMMNCAMHVIAQNADTAYLKNRLLKESDDSSKVNTLTNLCIAYLHSNRFQEALKCANQSIAIAEKIDFKKGIAQAYNALGDTHKFLENYPEALRNIYKALEIYESLNDTSGAASTYALLANTYEDQEDFPSAINSLYASERLNRSLHHNAAVSELYNMLANGYSVLGSYDSSLKYGKAAFDYYKKINDSSDAGVSCAIMGTVYEHKGDLVGITADDQKINYQLAEKYYLLAMNNQTKDGFAGSLADIYACLGSIYVKLKKLDIADAYAKKSLAISEKLHAKDNLKNAYSVLYSSDSAKMNYKAAFDHFKSYILYKDSLKNEESTKKSLQFQMQYEFNKKDAIAKAAQDKKDAESKRIRNQQLFTILALGIILMAAAVIAYIQFRNNAQKKKANAVLEKTLIDLRAAQAQLIQREKMASLGELTAGIAHEIQNPLNFVNNFSEVNMELLEELKEEARNSNMDEVKTIAGDIIENEKKINHHGRRAEVIVKGMMQHAQSGNGLKEPTNINALADEYLKLAYHGLKAKEKDLDITFVTNYSENIDKLNIVPQDMGKVLLNLYNNAFYAVNEKKKHHSENYTPTVTVSTKQTGKHLTIAVADNGPGIPGHIVDKIFQPFFTTKPTGQGTGLGLSLSYDIVAAFGGEIKVNSTPGDGCEFVVQLVVG